MHDQQQSSDQALPIAVIVGGDGPLLWSITGRERARRTLLRLGITVVEESQAPSQGRPVLLLHADFVLDARMVKALLQQGPALLEVAGDIAAALLPAGGDLAAVIALMTGESPADPAQPDLPRKAAAELTDDHATRRSHLLFAPPVALKVSQDNRRAVERKLFAGSYKGVTDLVTKWLWPWPASKVTAFCARHGISPNQVTLLSLVFAILAGAFFWWGWYGSGLLAGWLMTFLDTVDGKLARVTVTSSRFGDIFDHGLDIIHPPLWYAAWAVGLPGAMGVNTVAGLPLMTIVWIIVAGYILGRLAEGAFQPLMAPYALFVWRPFDSYNRLITARRNPNLILLTIAYFYGRPDLGLVAVAAWTTFSTLVLWIRVASAWLVKRASGELHSWMEDPQRAAREYPVAARLFGATGR